MKKIKLVIKFILNYLVKMISIFFKSSPQYIIVGGWFGRRFADNSKALFLYLSDNASNLNLKHVLFISKDKKIVAEIKKNGYRSLYKYSIKSIYWHFKSGIHIVDQDGCIDLWGWFSIKAKKVNLWHGFPLKKIGCYLNSDIKNTVEALEFQKRYERKGKWQNQFVLSLSDNHEIMNQFAFGCPSDKSIVGIYPRNYYMMSIKKKFYLEEEKKIVQNLRNIKKEKLNLIYYFPTFRDNEAQNRELVITINNLNNYLKKHNFFLVTKLHFATKLHDEEIINSLHIINLPPQSDVYNFLEFSDLLITDYSSIYFDYLLLNKPIIFYCFDLEYYQNTDRGFLFDYSKFTPGEKVYNMEGLKKTILNSLSFTDAYNEKYNDIKINVMKTVYNDILPTEKNMKELVDEILT